MAALAFTATRLRSMVPFSAKFNHGPMRERLAGERSVLIGQSGMGKSKLLNALVGSDAQRTSSEISQALDSGKHTTTFTRLFTIGSHDSWVIDSPGWVCRCLDWRISRATRLSPRVPGSVSRRHRQMPLP